MNTDGYKWSIRSTSALGTLMRVRSEQSAPMHFLGYCIATTICSRHASQAIILNSFGPCHRVAAIVNKRQGNVAQKIPDLVM